MSTAVRDITAVGYTGEKLLRDQQGEGQVQSSFSPCGKGQIYLSMREDDLSSHDQPAA